VLVSSSWWVVNLRPLVVLYESHMPAVLFEAGMIVNRAEEQVLSSASHRATVAKSVATAVERFCASASQT
jgi:N-acetylmuramoyl-L-alanine amidase